MNQAHNNVRIMAIFVKSQRAGVAVLDGAHGLLDWRIVHYKKNEEARLIAAKKKLSELMALHMPTVVVLGRANLKQVHHAAAVESVARAIRREAAQRSIPAVTLKRATVKDAFNDFGDRSREGIASMLARMFPELAPKLPPKRKIWQGEHSAITMFDAVALAVAHWARQLDAP